MCALPWIGSMSRPLQSPTGMLPGEYPCRCFEEQNSFSGTEVPSPDWTVCGSYHILNSPHPRRQMWQRRSSHAQSFRDSRHRSGLHSIHRFRISGLFYGHDRSPARFLPEIFPGKAPAFPAHPVPSPASSHPAPGTGSRSPDTPAPPWCLPSP